MKSGCTHRWRWGHSSPPIVGAGGRSPHASPSRVACAKTCASNSRSPAPHWASAAGARAAPGSPRRRWRWRRWRSTTVSSFRVSAGTGFRRTSTSTTSLPGPRRSHSRRSFTRSPSHERSSPGVGSRICSRHSRRSPCCRCSRAGCCWRFRAWQSCCWPTAAWCITWATTTPRSGFRGCSPRRRLPRWRGTRWAGATSLWG